MLTLRSSVSAPIIVPKRGTPRTNACVPSMGSTYQVQPLFPAVDPYSSPTIASSGAPASIRSRINRSAARSAIVTGVPSLLVSTSKLVALNSSSAKSPAARAAEIARFSRRRVSGWRSSAFTPRSTTAAERPMQRRPKASSTWTYRERFKIQVRRRDCRRR